MDNSIFFDEVAWELEWRKRQGQIVKYCSRCVYSNITPEIEFDGKGVCNYCRQHDELLNHFPGGQQGEQKFRKIVSMIKKEGEGKKYDVVIGVSGGCDSSYMVHLAKEHGLRPLAAHFDNTWNSTTAVENIRNVLEKADTELWTWVVDNEEYDDLYRAILNAGVPDLEAPTDLALAATLNIAAAKHGIRYIFEGHSFRSEGISPLGWLYMDVKYIADMYKKFGKGRKLKTYPHFWLRSQLKWMLLNRFKKIRPLWYLDYDKSQAKELLIKKYDWKWYGGHHLENRMSAFYQSYFLPRRFNIDQRPNGFSAEIRSGHMSRDEALEELILPPSCDIDTVKMVRKRWGYTDPEFSKLMALPIKRYTDYKSYKPTFERMRPFFYLMAKMELIPWSFYMKYTKKSRFESLSQ